MRLLNKFNLPSPVVRAVENDPYNRGESDISVTQLIDSPLIRRMRIKHQDNIEEDVTDRIWSLLGQAVHSILERGADSPDVEGAEERIYTTADDYIVSGQYDLIYRKKDGNLVLADYKVTSAWSVLYGSAKWEYQLNVLKWMVERETELTIDRLEVIAFLRDWVKTKAGDGKYPAAQVAIVEIPIWDTEKTANYVRNRLKLHFNEIEYMQCSNEERWYSGDKWAIEKVGRKSAVKVFNSKDEAEEELEEFYSNADLYSLEHRPGKYRRCEEYCDVAKWCPIWNPM